MKILDALRERPRAFRNNVFLFVSAYFLVLFNYPLIRASSTTLFFEAFGAKSTPVAMLWTVGVLSVSIFLCNRLQARLSVQRVFFLVSGFSAFLFLVSGAGFYLGHRLLSYVFFIWKEIYIVLQVHLLLAYSNNFFSKEDFRLFVGPLGAAGSLGGVLGGMLTSFIIDQGAGTSYVIGVGLCCVFLPALLFLFTQHVHAARAAEREAPLSSLKDPKVREYVVTIAAIVALTQFIINILDFRFNLSFEASIQDSNARTSYLGNIYTWTNGVTFLFQVFLLPYLLPRVSQRNFHLFLPLSYLVCTGIFFLGFQSSLLLVSLIYIYVKAADYSLFSAGKEILYQPLGPDQKYGAKYLTDMLVYRMSKALVAVVLIYLQSSAMLNGLMICFILLWLTMVIKLFRLQRLNT